MTTNKRNDNTTGNSAIGRIGAAIYGSVAYAIFFCTFVYAAGFITNFLVPKGIDTGESGPFVPSLAINVALLGLFGIQHSVMARPGFKKVWTRIIPKPIERSTFVLATCACLILMYWQWRTMPTVIWSIDDPVGRGVVWAVAALGWAIVFLATVMINHFDLFGLRQTLLYAADRPYTELGFKVTGFYKYVRHPLMSGFLIAFWATPDMTAGHLLFAGVVTAYIMVALQFEERDLVRHHGAAYLDYKRRVSGLVPLKKYDGLQHIAAASGAMVD